jgi:hypothetical protein
MEKFFLLARKHYVAEGEFYELRTLVVILLGRSLHFGTVDLRIGQMIIILLQLTCWKS